MFEVCSELCCHICFHSLLVIAQTSIWIRLLEWKKPNNRFEDMEVTAVDVIACGISLSELERAWNLQGWSTKKPHSLAVLFFGLGIFKCYTLLWNRSWNELQLFQNFQDEPRNFSGIFTKAFPQPPCLYFFFG